jgi:hypothetical protein
MTAEDRMMEFFPISQEFLSAPFFLNDQISGYNIQPFLFCSSDFQGHPS